MAESKKNLDLVWLLTGDAFLRDEKFSSILKKINETSISDVPVSRFRAAEDPVEKIIAEARSLPFLTSQQIFRLQDVDLLKGESLESLAAYLASPSSFTVLVLEAEALPKDHDLREAVKSCGQSMDLAAADKESAAQRKIAERLRQSGKTIRPAALKMLFDLMGDQPSMIGSVLEQMLLDAPETSEIGEETVNRFAERWQDLDAFQLGNAVAAGETGRALILLGRLLDSPDSEPGAMMGMLHWMIKRFWKAKVFFERGQSEDSVLRKLKVYPRQAPYFMRQLKMFSRKQLESAIEDLYQWDRKIKSGEAEEAQALECWLVRVSDRVRKPAAAR